MFDEEHVPKMKEKSGEKMKNKLTKMIENN